MDAHPERGPARVGRVRIPELLGQDVGRDDLVRVKQEERQERALLLPGEGNSARLTPDLERPQNAELHNAEANAV